MEAGNIEISEIVNVEPKWQCKFCLNHCDPGVIYCVCGRLTTKDSTENRTSSTHSRNSTSERTDHVVRYGTAQGCKEYHAANQLAKKCRKKEYDRIHDRNIRDKAFRKAMIEIGRSEQMMIFVSFAG